MNLVGHRPETGEAIFKHVNLADARVVFPDLGVGSFQVATNFDEIASSAAVQPRPFHSEDARSIALTGARYVCSFWPKRWLNDLSLTGISYLGLDYLLYVHLNNKLTQVNTLHDAGGQFLREALNKRTQLLGTEFRVLDNLDAFRLLAKRGDIVISARESAGGSGTFRVKDFAGFKQVAAKIDAPVVRIENFKPGTSYTHFGFVFEDQVISLPPQFQAIKEMDGQLAYVGAEFGVERVLPSDALEEMYRTTRSVGSALATLGYRGAFGCDYIYSNSDGALMFMELNPRFVGETFMYSKWAADYFLSKSADTALLLDPISLHIAGVLFHKMPKWVEAHLDDFGCLSGPMTGTNSVTSQMFVNLSPSTATHRGSVVDALNTDQVCLYSENPIISQPEVPVVLIPELEKLYSLVMSHAR